MALLLVMANPSDANFDQGGAQVRTAMSNRKTKINSKFQSQRGQSLLEMVLLLPLLLVLVIGALEFGRLFYTKIVITNAAREGAYYLATHPTDYNAGTGYAPNTVLAAQAEAMNSGVDSITVTVTPINCCTLGSYSVEVTVETSVQDLLILGLFGTPGSLSVVNNGSYPISASVEMMVQ
ncbi:MAG: TadE/TadG family type IV pilus assembly protein [Chloroflexota bacterium]|nr:TadE/TadG family type IV pilus assembly protein [Chloroflexota bacterium]